MNIEEIRTVCERATPGPLITSGACGEYVHNPESNFNFAMTRRRDDAEFIALARTALPEALDEIERLRSENERLSEKVKQIDALEYLYRLTITLARYAVEESEAELQRHKAGIAL